MVALKSFDIGGGLISTLIAETGLSLFLFSVAVKDKN